MIASNVIMMGNLPTLPKRTAMAITQPTLHTMTWATARPTIQPAIPDSTAVDFTEGTTDLDLLADRRCRCA